MPKFNRDRFTSAMTHYETNRRDGQSLKVLPADLSRPDGQQEPGIAFMVNGQPRLVIPAADAIRAAHAIADNL